MSDKPRLIEKAFPLKQASLDSVHEKNVRHGHISTLHIWPARRPLAACRAALITTLLPDPGDPKERKEILEKLGGKVVEKIERKKLPSGKVVENIKEETVGGILHWKRETENKETLDWFREEIKKAYDGNAPKVLDPFAGGGAIPLEAMRLGCEVTAIDINPVAWFILKCTLEYPQKLAGQKRPLPDCILKDPDFMEAFFKAQGLNGAVLRTQLEKLGFGENSQPFLKNFQIEEPLLEADLAWQVRAWGKWVLNQARKDLAKYYPTYADFEPLKESGNKYEKKEMKLVPVKDNGTPDIDALNVEFDKDYLKDKANPRWVAKPTVTYLWARTVKCKNCRAIIPLLKTRWLSKKANKRVLLTMEPNQDKTGVVFGVENGVPAKGRNPAQRREYDKRMGNGTMSRSGAKCPCCGTIMTIEDIRLEGRAGKLGASLFGVVVHGVNGNEYRTATTEEQEVLKKASEQLENVFQDIPYGIISEPTPAGGGKGAGRAFSVHGYGLMSWRDLFTPRQLLTLATFLRKTHLCCTELHLKYPDLWVEAITAYLACVLSRTADYLATLCVWEKGAEEVKHVFMRWALPVTWDFAEGNPLSPIERFYNGGLNSGFQVLSILHKCSWQGTLPPMIRCQSALKEDKGQADLILTDPPYYDAIPYSDLMDFFYIWLRRTAKGSSQEFDKFFSLPLGPKWNRDKNDGELIDDDSRHAGNSNASKECYENGIYRAFRSFSNKLSDNGRAVVVFANKNANAWEILVGSIIRAGFCVTSSWPIATEMPGGLRNLNRASLASSIWLVCKKRPLTARAGWDNKVLEEMRESIIKRLREFWDAGIRGPDFVWAATGPALEAYSKHPIVKKANEPGKLMDVSEFLRHVRRMVVDFVVGRVLSHDGESEDVTGLDDVTTYYLLHRNDFGLNDAPAGPCILYAVSCGLTDSALVDQFDILAKTGGKSVPEPEEEEAPEEEVGGGTGSTLRLKQWNQRKRQSMGYDPAIDSAKVQAKDAQMTFLPENESEKNVRRRQIPLIDQIHRLMHLWKGGELSKVDDYLDSRALLRNNTFHQLLQALIELGAPGSEERSILESISNQLKARGVNVEERQERLFR